MIAPELQRARLALQADFEAHPAGHRCPFCVARAAVYRLGLAVAGR